MLRDAREEAHNIISEAKEIADYTIREYNKLKKQNKNPDANKKMEHMRSDLRGRMTKLEGQNGITNPRKRTRNVTRRMISMLVMNVMYKSFPCRNCFHAPKCQR